MSDLGSPEVIINTEQYNRAKAHVACSTSDWLSILGISESLHKKLTGGFLPVSRATAAHVITLVRFVDTRRRLSELEDLIDRADVRDQLYRF